jgi:3-oxoacyl-[acyl-carrier-protein] synthase-3
MSLQRIEGLSIKGVSVAIPKNVESNYDYDVIPENLRSRFIESIGIEQRHIVEPGVCTSDLCYAAAQNLITRLNWDKNEIDLLVFVSQTPDYKMPATSCVLQHRLGLNNRIMAFDVSQGCTGYLYGLGIVGSLISSGQYKKALLLVGNTQSLNTSYYDQSAYPLFGDAGSATAIEFACSNSDRIVLGYYTEGAGANSIIIPDGGYRNPVNQQSYIMEEFEGGIRRNRMNLKMVGDDVFSFVISQVPKVVNDLLTQEKVSYEDIDYLLLHQASLFTCNSLRKKLRFPVEKTPYILSKFGNCSNASVPMLMAESIKAQCLKGDLQLLVTSFGVGLSIACCLLHISGLAVCDWIEV